MPSTPTGSQVRVRQYKGDGSYQRGLKRMQREGWTVSSVTTTSSRRPIGLLFGLIGYWLLPRKTVHHVTFTKAAPQVPRATASLLPSHQPPPEPSTAASPNSTPWWQHEAAIAWAMMLVPPIGLVLMWRHARWRSRTKRLWTIAYAGLAVLVIAAALSPADEPGDDAQSASATLPPAATSASETSSPDSTARREAPATTSTPTSTLAESTPPVPAVAGSVSKASPLITGFGALDADWNARHSPSRVRGLIPGAAYDTLPDGTDRFVGVLHHEGRVIGFFLQFPGRGVEWTKALADVLDLLPADATVVEEGKCSDGKLFLLRSPTLGDAFAAQDATKTRNADRIGDHGGSVEVGLYSYRATYRGDNVDTATVSIGLEHVNPNGC